MTKQSEHKVNALHISDLVFYAKDLQLHWKWLPSWFCEIFKNIFFTEYLQTTTASVNFWMWIYIIPRLYT